MTNISKLQEAFRLGVLSTGRITQAETKYSPSAILGDVGALDGKGAVAYVERLINRRREAPGFAQMWKLKRLDLTVEAMVRDDKRWHPLFDPMTIMAADKRLKAHGYP